MGTGGVLQRNWDLAPKSSTHTNPLRKVPLGKKKNQFKGEIVESEKHRWQQSQYNEFFINLFIITKPEILKETKFKQNSGFVAHCKNLPLLSLAHQKETIRALEPLKAMVTTVSEECTQQILALQEKEKVEISTLKQEKHHLLKFIDNMKEEKSSLQTQVNKLSVAEEYTRYLQEYGARKLLLAKLNEMHNEQLNVKQHQVQGDKGEDVVKLTLALKMARQDLTKAQVKLNAMTAEYGDVVPRRDFESLEKKYSDLLQEMKTLRKDFEQLHEEYETLLEIHRETAEERDSFHTQLQEAERSHTPRPNWAKCSEVIPGGVERWGCLAEGKSSNQLVDVLLEEIGTGVLKEMNVFHGWGKGDKVPVYLRYEGDIKNKKPTKKDVVNILKDIWREKIALDQQQSSLPEFFLSYLQKKYGDASAVEWSYNLYEYMRLCPSNHIMSSFYEILTGKVGNPCLCAAPLMALKEAFPLKRRDAIQELVDASRFNLDSDEDLIDYTSLFKEDEEGNPEPFVAKLRNQYISEKQEYLQELKNSLGDPCLSPCHPSNLTVPICSSSAEDELPNSNVSVERDKKKEGSWEPPGDWA
uniref:Translin-associated factor X-interacting protein 1 N-terminal domain-containing protein n=1 Tax=Phasianus colchicus TaxID=9054 RepID=A0A669QR22_PHACC